MRTIRKYLSRERHETDVVVKPEVFMTSTHLFMPYEAEIFMNGYIIQTYLSQFWCLFWNAKYCSDAFSETLNIVLMLLLKCQIFMDTWCHIYTWGLLFFVHWWAFLANNDVGDRLTSMLTKRDWDIYFLFTKRDWTLDTRVQIKANWFISYCENNT